LDLVLTAALLAFSQFCCHRAQTGMAYSDEDFLVQALVTPIIVFQLACALWVLGSLYEVGLSPFRRAWDWSKALFSHNKQTSEELQEVRKIVRAYCKHIAVTASYISWVVVCLSSLTVVVGAFRSTPTVSIASASCTLILVTSLTLTSLFPMYLLTDTAAPVAHVIFMAGLCYMALNSFSDSATKDGAILLLSFVGAAFCFRSRVFVLTNLCLQACLVYFELQDSADRDDVDLRRALLPQTFTLFMKLTLLCGAEGVLWRNATNEVQAKAGQCTQSAVSSLLDLLCDVVIDLDHGLKLKSAPAKFAGMLMRQGGRTLEGCDFMSYIKTDGDRSRFENMVRSRTVDEDQSTAPSMVTLGLRDSIGSVVRVAMYHVPYTSIGGQTHHLVGIVEEDTVRNGGFDASNSDNGARAPEAMLLPHMAAELANRSQPCLVGARSRGSRRSSASSSTNRSRSSLGAPDERFSIEFYLDVGLPIRWASEALTTELGVEVASSFAQLLPDAGHRLRTWCESVVDEMRKAGNSGGFKQHYGELTMTPANGAPSSTPVRRQTWVYFPAPLSSEDGSPLLLSLAMGTQVVHASGTAFAAVREALASRPQSSQTPEPPALVAARMLL